MATKKKAPADGDSIREQVNAANQALRQKLLIAHSELATVHAHLADAHVNILGLLQKVKL